MNALYLLFYVSIAVWFLSEIYYKQKFRSEEKDQKKDKSTLNILWVVIIPSIFIAVTISNLTKFHIRNQYWILYLGEFLIIIGIVFRWIIIKSLGNFFTVDVSIRENHQIKKGGFYRLVRHPSYSFALLTFLGLGLFLNNWLSLCIAFVPVFLAFSYRIKVEEQVLIQQFGNEYLEYKQKTKKLIPFIY